MLLFVSAIVSIPFSFSKEVGDLIAQDLLLDVWSSSQKVSDNKPSNISQSTSSAISNDELNLYKLIMNYRLNNGLLSIPLSPNLSYVARLHAQDLELHSPSSSMHSWSDNGKWKPFNYKGSENAEDMWNKPSELTNYTGNGYEIVSWTSGRMNPAMALSLWMESSQHNIVIINAGIWESLRWNAIGIAISAHYAIVWFGEEPDIGSK